MSLHCEKCGSANERSQRPAGRFCYNCGRELTEIKRRCPQRRRFLDGHYETSWYVIQHVACGGSGEPPND